MSPDRQDAGAGSAWRALATAAAAVTFVVVVAVGVARRDQEALAFAAVIPVALGLAQLPRGLAGRVLLALLFVDVAVWMLPAALSNVAHREAFTQVLVPVTLVALSAAGLVALAASAVAAAGSRPAGGSPGRVPAVAVAAATVALTVVVLGAAAVRGRPGGTVAQPGDLIVSSRSMAFSPESLRVAPGRVGVAMTNHDLFWHTFTVSSLGVDLRVPVGATRRTSFDGPPGTYEFVCQVPGHTAAGMRGTLVIR